jgi:hypothetical protein
MGVFYNDRGVLLRWFERSTVIPWSEITRFEALPTRRRATLTTPEPAIWIVVVGGAQMETPVLRGNFWLVPMASWEMSPASRIYLSDARFDRALQRLRAAHMAHEAIDHG